MCEFHDSSGNGFGDIWWTDNPIYFSSIDMYNALFYILYLVMYFIDIIFIFILHTKTSCYLFFSLIIKQYVHVLASCFCSLLHENIVILRYITR